MPRCVLDSALAMGKCRDPAYMQSRGQEVTLSLEKQTDKGILYVADGRPEGMTGVHALHAQDT
jgi:hypothetical protein